MAVTSLVPVQQAAAQENQADPLVAEVRAATPVASAASAQQSPALAATTTSYVYNDPAGSGEQHEIPFDPTQAVTVSDGSGATELSVTLPDQDFGSATLNSEGDSVAYVAAPDSGVTAATVENLDEGVQIGLTVEQPSAADAGQALAINVPAGGSIETPDGPEQGAAVLDSDGSPIGYVAPAWATDAGGKRLPVSISVESSAVRLEAETDASTAYPFVVAMVVGPALIKRAYWDWQPLSPGHSIGTGWTLRVTPTRWARVHVGSHSYGILGFAELRRKYGLTRHLSSMQDQYVCHQQFVTVRDPGAPTWNLDQWRADRSYFMTVRYQCNPPKGGPYCHDKYCPPYDPPLTPGGGGGSWRPAQ